MIRIMCIAVLLHSSFVFGDIVMGVEAPTCVNKEVKNEEDAKCIVLFYAQFISVLDPLGGAWDVKAIHQDGFWYIYPATPTERIHLDTLLFKINDKSGETSKYLPEQ